MNKILAILGVVVVLVAVAWGLTQIKVAAPEGGADKTHILAGKQTATGNFRYTENGDYYTIEANYPATTTLEGSADLKARTTMEHAISNRIAEFKQNGNFANLTQEDIQIQGLGVDRKYALGIDYKEYLSPQYDSYLYVVYEDTLGAHPNAYFMTFVFDKVGNEVSIKDILASNPNGLEELSLLVVGEGK